VVKRQRTGIRSAASEAAEPWLSCIPQRRHDLCALRTQPTTAGTIPITANSIEESEALTLDFNKLAKVAEVPGVLPLYEL
jgi:hypothetical protein